MLQLVDARRCLEETLPAADAATLATVAASDAITEGRASHVLVLTKADKLKERDVATARDRLEAAAAAAYAGAAAQPVVVSTAATARPPVGREEVWRAILEGLT